ARRLQELEADHPPPVIGRVDAHALDALDLLQLRLGQPRLLGLVPEALDEALQARDLLRLALRGLRLVDVARGLLAPPDVPRTREVGRAAPLELEHGSRDRLEEPAAVRGEDHARVDSL